MCKMSCNIYVQNNRKITSVLDYFVYFVIQLLSVMNCLQSPISAGRVCNRRVELHESFGSCDFFYLKH
jgi:hypothetical protein